jgi:transitional endoplasmic reticulum ATPase
VFHDAKLLAPCVLFLDEIDAVFGSREQAGELGKKIVSQLLQEIDALDHVEGGHMERVVVLAATNFPEALDAALIRPGRLDRLVYVPPPSHEDRVAILQTMLRRVPCEPRVLDSLHGYCAPLNGYTGADLSALVRLAALSAMQRSPTNDTVELQDMQHAVTRVPPSVTPLILARYISFHSM